MPLSIPRRDLLKSALIGFGACLGLPSWAAQTAGDRDRFGGWTGLKFDATGSFRTEHDGQRWWLVTPEGHAFISWGVNHYHANWWAQDYNRDHWLRRFDAEEVYHRAWNRGFREAALADLRRLGLNTLGIHTNATMLTHPPGRARFPFVAPYEPLVLSHYLKPQPDAHADIFAPEFKALCERTARRAATPTLSTRSTTPAGRVSARRWTC